MGGDLVVPGILREYGLACRRRQYRWCCNRYCRGGPGAVFWMWVIAATMRPASLSTLAQIYKIARHGLFHGGPAYYIQVAPGSSAVVRLATDGDVHHHPRFGAGEYDKILDGRRS